MSPMTKTLIKYAMSIFYQETSRQYSASIGVGRKGGPNTSSGMMDEVDNNISSKSKRLRRTLDYNRHISLNITENPNQFPKDGDKIGDNPIVSNDYIHYI